MVNYNGKIYPESTVPLSVDNRGLNYGDALFETIKVINKKILFWEAHYFRLMASMRILRMEIPMTFTMEYLEGQILNTIEQNGFGQSTVRIKLLVYRDSNGLYMPETNDVGFLIRVKELDTDIYLLNDNDYVVDLYKDHYILSGLLSSLKTTNRIINITGSIYARENNLQNCLLLNDKKQVVEALNGNIFLVSGNRVKTPTLESGCIKGVMRNQIIQLIKTLPDYELIESEISPFELQKADELFISNVITGIVSISRYRKRDFNTILAQNLIGKLNAKVRLG